MANVTFLAITYQSGAAPAMSQGQPRHRRLTRPGSEVQNVHECQGAVSARWPTNKVPFSEGLPCLAVVALMSLLASHTGSAAAILEPFVIYCFLLAKEIRDSGITAFLDFFRLTYKTQPGMCNRMESKTKNLLSVLYWHS